MTSSNGNIFRVTVPLCGEFTGPGEFPTQRPVTRSFDVFFDLRLNKQLSKQPWGWWFETPSWSLWRQRNERSRVLWYFLCYLNKATCFTWHHTLRCLWNVLCCRILFNPSKTVKSKQQFDLACHIDLPTLHQGLFHVRRYCAYRMFTLHSAVYIV